MVNTNKIAYDVPELKDVLLEVRVKFIGIGVAKRPSENQCLAKKRADFH